MALFVQHLRRRALHASSSSPLLSAACLSTLRGGSGATTASRFGGSSTEVASVLSTQFSVRNGSAVQGRLQLQLPLPGLLGLTSIQVNDETQTVEKLLETLKKTDTTLKSVDITTTNGTKLARTVQLSELTTMEFVLRLNHVNILIQNDNAKEDPREIGENAAFASIKAQIETDSRPFLPLDEYYRICLNAGAEEPVANKWLRELQCRNLVTHFDRSTNAELKNAIILRPHGAESLARVHSALDSELSTVKQDRKVHEARLEELQSELKKLVAINAETRKAAQTLPNVQKWVVFTGLTSFYGSLMYLVWDVYSWDIMEPITYFIGFTAVLGNSFYHTITKKDATYTNIWQKKYLARAAKLQEERKFNPAKIPALQASIAQIERDVAMLAQWEEGKKPSSSAL
ncbi:V-type atpase, g subunit, partial [Globisporangium splendens]